MTAIAGALLCCCEASPCNCSSYSSVMLTWDGLIEFAYNNCVEDPDSGIYMTASFGPIAIECLRQEIPDASGNCAYLAETITDVDYFWCIDNTLARTDKFHVKARVTKGALWSAQMCFKLVDPLGTSFGGCSYCGVGFNVAILTMDAQSPTEDAVCPPFEEYPTTFLCEPAGAGGLISAYTSGVLTVS